MQLAQHSDSCVRVALNKHDLRSSKHHVYFQRNNAWAVLDVVFHIEH